MAPQSTAVPPSLPPSVEEAYRRKCVQLKNRTNEVEDANDAARLRLSRIKRQVEKLRIERAFLLEQLAKRTSTNVEDSEGSPSPPPTATTFDIPIDASANPRKPKDKPLRNKKGHRKSAAVGDGDTKSNAKDPASPTSETNKASHPNGVSQSDDPKTPFDIYCEENRSALEAKEKDDGELNIEEELTRGWDELPEAEKEEFQNKFDSLVKAREEDKAAAEAEEAAEAADAADGDDETPKKSVKAEPEADKPETQDEDVEMSNYDTEDQETQMDKDGDD